MGRSVRGGRVYIDRGWGAYIPAYPLLSHDSIMLACRVCMGRRPTWAIRAAKKTPNLDSFWPILRIPVRESKGLYKLLRSSFI